MRSGVGVVVVSVVVALGAVAMTVSGGPGASRAVGAIPVPAPAGFEANSTQAVCALTGNHGRYRLSKPGLPTYEETDYGLISGDSGSSFEFGGKVWWLFGNTGATDLVGKVKNASKRWPKVRKLEHGFTALDSDSIATSSVQMPPPAPAVPYTGTGVPPNQHCPILHFPTQTGAVPGPYLSPSLARDPLFPGAHRRVSLRTGELPEAGISEGDPAQMYVVFGTDSPANCATLSPTPRGPCPEPAHGVSVSNVCHGAKASRTRSVMAVYTGSGLRFDGLYDLSPEPGSAYPRYRPTCSTPLPSDDPARFVNVQMANGTDGYLYIWGTEGGADDNQSPVYLARMPAANIATGQGIAYWSGQAFVAGKQSAAAPLFTDQPNPCASQLGIQHNPYLDEWIMLYRCKESAGSVGPRNGIFMRSAPNPWGPWSSPTTIFNPAPDQATASGYCYFIYSKQTATKAKPGGSPRCPRGSRNKGLADLHHRLGSYYGPYFVANWTTGTAATASVRATTTIYYTLDTFDPYGQLILRSTILGPAPPRSPIPKCCT